MPTKTQKKYVPGSLGRYFAMFVAPALIVYLVFSIVPFLFTIYYSFTDYTDMNPINLHFTGIENYIKVLNSPLMRTAIKNSLIYAVVLTGAQVVLGLPLAVILNMKLRTRNLLRATFFFPAVFSSLIIGYLWNFILSSSNYGLINNLLKWGCRLSTSSHRRTHFTLFCSRRSGSGLAGRWSSSLPICRASRAICTRQLRSTVPAALPAFSVSRCR